MTREAQAKAPDFFYPNLSNGAHSQTSKATFDVQDYIGSTTRCRSPGRSRLEKKSRRPVSRVLFPLAGSAVIPLRHALPRA